MNERVYEWRRKFFSQHGGIEAAITEVDRNEEETGFLLFPDGARCEQWQEGACEEPPDNEVKRLKRVVRYREEMLRRAEHAFGDLKQKIAALHGQGDYYGKIEYQTDGLDLNDKTEALQALKQAQARVLDKRHELAAARQQLQSLTMPKDKQRRLQRLNEQIEKQDDRFRDELKRTRI